MLSMSTMTNLPEKRDARATAMLQEAVDDMNWWKIKHAIRDNCLDHFEKLEFDEVMMLGPKYRKKVFDYAKRYAKESLGCTDVFVAAFVTLDSVSEVVDKLTDNILTDVRNENLVGADKAMRAKEYHRIFRRKKRAEKTKHRQASWFLPQNQAPPELMESTASINSSGRRKRPINWTFGKRINKVMDIDIRVDDLAELTDNEWIRRWHITKGRRPYLHVVLILHSDLPQNPRGIFFQIRDFSHHFAGLRLYTNSYAFKGDNLPNCQNRMEKVKFSGGLTDGRNEIDDEGNIITLDFDPGAAFWPSPTPSPVSETTDSDVEYKGHKPGLKKTSSLDPKPIPGVKPSTKFFNPTARTRPHDYGTRLQDKLDDQARAAPVSTPGLRKKAADEAEQAKKRRRTSTVTGPQPGPSGTSTASTRPGHQRSKTDPGASTTSTPVARPSRSSARRKLPLPRSASQESADSNAPPASKKPRKPSQK